MSKRVIGRLVLALSVSTWGFAQQQGGAGGGGNTGGGNTGGGQPGGAQPGGTGGGQQGGQGGRGGVFGGQQDRPTFEQAPRPIFLSGKVVMDSGEVPPEPVTIQRVCHGQVFPEGYSDSKGRFSFQLGADPTVGLSDASVSGYGSGLGGGFPGAGGSRNTGFGGGPLGGGVTSDSMGGVDLTGCDLRADLPGHRSDSIPLGRRRPMDNSDIGIIVLHRLGDFEGAAISATTMLAPKSAKKAYEKGVKELSKKDGKIEKAAEEFEKAVAEHPSFAAAWTYLAETRSRLNDEPGAIAALEKAIEADAMYVRPYGPLVQLNLRNGNWERAAELSETVLRLNPAQPQMRYFHAVANFNLGKLEEAEQTVSRMREEGDAGNFPQVHHMIGMIYSRRGAFKQAAVEYRSYLERSPDAPSADSIRKQLHEWEVLGVIDPVVKAAVAP